MSRSARSTGRCPMQAVLALSVSVALAVNPAPAVASGGLPGAQPAAAPAPAPAPAALNWSDLVNREIVVGGVKVPVPAAIAGIAAAAAVLGGLSVVVLHAVAGVLPPLPSAGSSQAGSSERDVPGVGGNTAPGVAGPGEYANRFDFSAANTDPAVGGFSGIDQVGPGSYIVLSDDKGEHGPVRAYHFSTADHATFTLAGVVEFTDVHGTPYTEYMDPEEIRVLPNGNFLWTTEGSGKLGKVVAPQLIESTPDGKEVRRIDVPKYHVPNGFSTRGIHHNNGPEGMTLLDDGRTAVTIEENSLAQDGQKNSAKHSSLNRITFYDLESGRPTKEFVVRVNAGRGATSLLADEDGELYVLERGFFKDLGENGENKAEIYKLDLSGADDVLGKKTLNGTEKTASKSLVFDFASKRPHPDNTEGLAWGPRSSDGRRLMIVVTDNNFSDSQKTYFHSVLVP